MPPFKDLTGQRFGRWIVLYRAEDYISPKGHPMPQFMCKCECGKKNVVPSQTLTRGESKSCGCGFGLRRKDITGQRFGKLTAIRVVGKEANRETIWECLCDCGSILSVFRRSLIAGRTKSCGCRGKESWLALQVKEYFALYHSAIIEYKILRNPKTGRYLPYDIYLPGGTFIELNGAQHYEYVPYFHNKSFKRFEYKQSIDELKKSFAKTNGNYIEVDLRKIKSPEEIIHYIEERI